MRKSGLGRLGLSYDEVKEINPDIVYAHGSGQGDKGPLLNRQSNDIIGQFWGAYVSYGSAEGPMSIWSDFADRGGAGYARLWRCPRTSRPREAWHHPGGQYLPPRRSGLPRSPQFQQRLFEGEAVSPLPNGDGRLPNPLYNVYQDKKGDWFCIGAEGTDEEWGSLCQAVGSPGLESDPRFDTQAKRTNGSSADLYEILKSRFAEDTIEHWAPALDGTNLPWARLRNYTEVINDPHVLENEFIAELDHPNQGKLHYVGLPVKLSKTPGKLRMPAP